MAKVEIYTKIEMSFIKIINILNQVRVWWFVKYFIFIILFQILLLCCCSMSLLGFMSDIYNHDVEYNLSEEELAELDETPLMERATIVSNLLPTLSIFTAIFLLIAKYSSERSSRINNNVESWWRIVLYFPLIHQRCKQNRLLYNLFDLFVYLMFLE